jgi:hypothetical protein
LNGAPEERWDESADKGKFHESA